MLTEEVDIGLRPATIFPITQVDLEDFWVSHFSYSVDKNVHDVDRDEYMYQNSHYTCPNPGGSGRF